MRRLAWMLVSAVLVAALMVPLVTSAQGGRPIELRADSAPFYGVPTNGSAPNTQVPLVVDDGSSENSIGVNGAGVAFQFIWLNRFTPAVADYPFTLTQIWVLWPTGQVAVGDAIELAVYEDADGNPANGATFLASVPVTVTVVGGSQWAKYNLAAPVVLNGPSGDVLIAAIDRFVVSGVTPQNFPAAIDTTATQGRSWVGWWNADPPEPPVLPPDLTFDTIDNLGFPGNWMIRGYGVKAPTAVSVTSLVGAAAPLPLALLALPAALLLGLAITRRRGAR